MVISCIYYCKEDVVKEGMLTTQKDVLPRMCKNMYYFIFLLIRARGTITMKEGEKDTCLRVLAVSMWM